MIGNDRSQEGKVEKLFQWVRRLERLIVPQAVRDWYNGLSTWPHNFVNWVVVHGGITALVVLLGAIVAGNVGAWIGYALGAGFYIVKETVSWKAGGSRWPSMDNMGDALGPVFVGLGAVFLLT